MPTGSGKSSGTYSSSPGGGRGRGGGDESPEEKARNQIRYANALQAEQARRAQIAARLQWRDTQIKRGVPDGRLIPASRIAEGGGVNDNEWASHIQDTYRFFGAPAPTRTTTIAAPGTAAAKSLVKDPAAGGPRMTEAQIAASGQRSVLTDFIAKTPKGYDYNIGSGEYIPKTQSGFINGMEIKAGETYGDAQTRAKAEDVANTARVVGAPLETSPLLTRDATAWSPLAAGRGQPVLPTLPPSPNFPPSGAERAGLATRTALTSLIPGAVAPFKAIGDELGEARKSVSSGVIQPIVDFGRGLVQNTNPGASTSQAARIQTPTFANPTSRTDTSPNADIDRSASSISRFGLSDEEWSKNRAQFAGF